MFRQFGTPDPDPTGLRRCSVTATDLRPLLRSPCSLQQSPASQSAEEQEECNQHRDASLSLCRPALECQNRMMAHDMAQDAAQTRESQPCITPVFCSIKPRQFPDAALLNRRRQFGASSGLSLPSHEVDAEMLRVSNEKRFSGLRVASEFDQSEDVGTRYLSCSETSRTHRRLEPDTESSIIRKGHHAISRSNHSTAGSSQALIFTTGDFVPADDFKGSSTMLSTFAGLSRSPALYDLSQALASSEILGERQKANIAGNSESTSASKEDQAQTSHQNGSFGNSQTKHSEPPISSQ